MPIRRGMSFSLFRSRSIGSPPTTAVDYADVGDHQPITQQPPAQPTPSRRPPSPRKHLSCDGIVIRNGHSSNDNHNAGADHSIVSTVVATLNRGGTMRNFSKLVTLKTKVVINDREFDLAEFLNIVKEYSNAFPDREISVVGTMEDDGAVSSGDNNTNNDKFAPDGLITVVLVIAYRNNTDQCQQAGQPWWSEEALETLQCRVDQNGKLIKIHWKAYVDQNNPCHKPNRIGMIRYAEEDVVWTQFLKQTKEVRQ